MQLQKVMYHVMRKFIAGLHKHSSTHICSYNMSRYYMRRVLHAAVLYVVHGHALADFGVLCGKDLSENADPSQNTLPPLCTSAHCQVAVEPSKCALPLRVAVKYTVPEQAGIRPSP
jgi:hypothetical protein